MMRSRSVTSRRARISSSRSMVCSTSACTPSRRRRMAAGEMRGCSIQLRIMREPMAVFVLSSTHRRLPFFSPPRRVSVSSRLRRAVRSSSMKRSLLIVAQGGKIAQVGALRLVKIVEHAAYRHGRPRRSGRRPGETASGSAPPPPGAESGSRRRPASSSSAGR